MVQRICFLFHIYWRSRMKFLLLKPFVVFTGLFLLILFICYAWLAPPAYSKYPLANAQKYVDQVMSGIQPDIAPINQYMYPFIIPNEEKCKSELINSTTLTLLLIVKSAVNHFERRNAIRETWGWEIRYPDVTILRVFNLGMTNDAKLMLTVQDEQMMRKDLVQGDFIDSYYNNTIKTMMGIRWVVEYCNKTDFVLFVDDDYYISMKNLLHFISNPYNYPHNVRLNSHFQKRSFENFWSGFTYFNETPHRSRMSKWYVALDEYAYGTYPPFITAGAFVVSIQTLYTMYYTSMYTAHFRFDDIYVALLAYKAGIHPVHSEYFYNLKRNVPADLRFVIAAHGYGNISELIHVWWDQIALHQA